MFRIAPLPEKPNLHSENLKIEYRVQNTEYRQDMRKYIYIVVALLCFTACQKEAVQPKVYGRYVPERKDDFAWENEYAAFRMYGPALADENPSNGVDLWLKNSPALAVDTMYARELKDGRPYHINYDGNIDCYKVGHTAGCGGLALMTGEGDSAKLWIGGPYSSWEILAQEADRFSFKLHYDSLQVGEQKLTADVIITAQAGELLNKAQVVIGTKGEALPALLAGGGIYLHDTVDAHRVWENSGAVAYAEEALSDKHAAELNYEYNGSTSQGRSYIAVVTPGATKQTVVDGTLVSLKPYATGDTLTYYFGACWSEWHDGEKSFATDEAWFDAIKNLQK
jgi:hypothetical protein